MIHLDDYGPDGFTTLSVADAQDSLEQMRRSLLVLDVWTTEDDTWHSRFPGAKPIVVDQTDACRLEQVWPGPAGQGPLTRERAHVLTITGLLPGGYVHVLVGQRPSTRDTWTILAVETLQLKFMVGFVSDRDSATTDPS